MGSLLRVGNLSPSVSEDQLREKFASIGPVASVSLIRDPVTFAPLASGWVNFEKEEDAAKALANLNFTLLDGKPIQIRGPQTTSVKENGTVVVKNLDDTVTHAEIYQLFVRFGVVQNLKLYVSEEYEKSSKAILFFELEKSAWEATQQMNGVSYKDRSLVVTRESFHQPTVGLSLFVTNLAKSVNDAELAKAFAKHRGFRSANVITDDIGRSKGFGFVQYASEAEANTAMVKMDGTTQLTLSQKIPLQVKRAIERGDRKQPQVVDNGRSNLTSPPKTAVQPLPAGESANKLTTRKKTDEPVEAEQIAMFDLVSHPKLAEFLFLHCEQLDFWRRFRRPLHLVNVEGKFRVKTTEQNAEELQRQVRGHLKGIVKEKHPVSQAAYEAVVTEEKRRKIELKTTTLIRLDPRETEESQVRLSIYGRPKNIVKAKVELDQLVQKTTSRGK